MLTLLVKMNIPGDHSLHMLVLLVFFYLIRYHETMLCLLILLVLLFDQGTFSALSSCMFGSLVKRDLA